MGFTGKTHGDASHGKAATEYIIWMGMKARCSNRKNKDYPRYGGRGVSVCREWSDSYPEFLRYMGRRPSRLYSIDRWPNKNGNYEPGNCRWATSMEQGRNKRSNRLIEILGAIHTLSEWAEISGINRAVLSHRIKAGWPERMILESGKHFARGNSLRSINIPMIDAARREAGA